MPIMEGRAAEIQSLHPTYAKAEGTRESRNTAEAQRAESRASERIKRVQAGLQYEAGANHVQCGPAVWYTWQELTDKRT